VSPRPTSASKQTDRPCEVCRAGSGTLRTHGDGVRVFCPACGSSQWRPYYEIREVICETRDGPADAIEYYCLRHDIAHVRDLYSSRRKGTLHDC